MQISGTSKNNPKRHYVAPEKIVTRATEASHTPNLSNHKKKRVVLATTRARKSNELQHPLLESLRKILEPASDDSKSHFAAAQDSHSTVPQIYESDDNVIIVLLGSRTGGRKFCYHIQEK